MLVAVLLSACALSPIDSEVTFKGTGGLELKGSLVMPVDAKSPVPGVLLLPGSGPTDRNGNQLPRISTDLLKQIAERLSKAGIASLRFDKRATPAYANRFPKELAAQNEFFSWESFVGDARAAFDFLRTHGGIDPKKTVICGHSEGSMIAGYIGHELVGKPGAPAGLILMGAPGRTLDVVVREQVRSNLKRTGLPDATVKVYTDYVDAAIEAIKGGGSAPPNPPQGLASLFPPSANKLMRSYFVNDPSKFTADFDGPILIVQGEKDIQVLAKTDTPVLEAALRTRKKGTLEVFVVPSASHNIKAVVNENVEPGFSGPVVQAALDKIVSWLGSALR